MYDIKTKSNGIRKIDYTDFVRNLNGELVHKSKVKQ